MNNNGQVIGVKRLTPIIDFNCIVDTEYGLLQLIYDQYYDLSVFNQKKFEMPVNKILWELYTRKEKNPLMPFINEGVSKEDADDYYNQFMSTKYEEILERSIGTNIQMAIINFNSSVDVFASILCHNDLEKEYISGLKDFSSNRIFTDDEFKKEYKRFNQIYLKYVDDISKYLKQCLNKIIYISTHHLNTVNEEENIDLKDDKNLNTVLKYSNIALYDLYNIEFLKGE